MGLIHVEQFVISCRSFTVFAQTQAQVVSFSFSLSNTSLRKRPEQSFTKFKTGRDQANSEWEYSFTSAYHISTLVDINQNLHRKRLRRRVSRNKPVHDG